jgi:hypothetical protein
VLAAGNRSLVVSEPILPHCPQCVAGIHYVSTSNHMMVKTLLYHLKHENERMQLIENAFQLVTTELTLCNSIKAILAAVDEVRSDKNIFSGVQR